MECESPGRGGHSQQQLLLQQQQQLFVRQAAQQPIIHQPEVPGPVPWNADIAQQHGPPPQMCDRHSGVPASTQHHPQVHRHHSHPTTNPSPGSSAPHQPVATGGSSGGPQGLIQVPRPHAMVAAVPASALVPTPTVLTSTHIDSGVANQSRQSTQQHLAQPQQHGVAEVSSVPMTLDVAGLQQPAPAAPGGGVAPPGVSIAAFPAVMPVQAAAVASVDLAAATQQQQQQQQINLQLSSYPAAAGPGSGSGGGGTHATAAYAAGAPGTLPQPQTYIAAPAAATAQQEQQASFPFTLTTSANPAAGGGGGGGGGGGAPPGGSLLADNVGSSQQAHQSSRTSSGERSEESPMVGVCVQQSPVVSH